jgi:4-amino-4-deoxychorismate lyase
MILINGENKHTLEITDRGLHYGDGLFETIEVIQQQPVFLRQHLARLKAGCQVLKIPYPDEALLLDEIRQVSKTCEQGVIKLILTRGSGGRGYRQPDLLDPTRIIALHPFPDYPEHYKIQGIKARFCNTRLGLNPLLAGLKHNNRLEQVLARAEWQDEFQEGLMLNLNEHVIEGTMSNLFVVKEKKIYTPEIIVSGIKGVMRQLIINIAQKNKISIQETLLTEKRVLDADELFVSNSVIGIWPIRSLKNKSYPVGSITQKIMAHLTDYKAIDIAA